MNRVLVSGASGFIGSNLIKAFQAKYPDCQITGIDNFESGVWGNLKGFKGELICEDMTEGEWRVRDDFDLIIHLAGDTDTRRLTPDVVQKNIRAFKNAMSIAFNRKARFFYASSAAVYGVRDGKMSTDDEMKPANIYGFSKMIQDNIARMKIKEYRGWQIVGMRFFNVYGPNEGHKNGYASMIHQMANWMNCGLNVSLFKDGNQQRDFIYIDDVVKLMFKLIDSRESGIFNFGTGIPRSFNEVFSILKSKMNYKKEIVFKDCHYKYFQKFTQADMSWAKDFQPISLEDGISKFLTEFEKA